MYQGIITPKLCKLCLTLRQCKTQIMKLQTNIFQPQQNENRSPSPMGGLFKKCSVTDMSSKIPGVSFLSHWQTTPYFEINLLFPF